MSRATAYEVPEPIINSPFEEPHAHWHIAEGEEPEKRPGHRPAMYYYRDPKAIPSPGGKVGGTAIELLLVNHIRQRLAEWRKQGYPNATRTTVELLQYWRRDGRRHRLFFAQLEAAETIIFLSEARADLLQGLPIPVDEPSLDQRAAGARAFRRYACKMATGSGKTTVMGLLAAWSILNKVQNRTDARFSDAVLIVCPNVTIRDRLRELDPELGDASLYRTRDLVPQELMPELRQGRVLVRNWHIFERKSGNQGDPAKVVKTGVREERNERIYIGEKTTTARQRKYLTCDDYKRQVTLGQLEVIDEELDEDGQVASALVQNVRYFESDASLLKRILGRDIGGKKNLLVMNDEAHHAYRIRKEEPDEGEDDLFGDEDAAEEYFKEATVWIEGLDRVHRHRGINFCVDLSATPYYLGRVGQQAHRPFPWVVSDFGLVDAIESGLVKIPQLAIRDSTGADVPGYFNIWSWVMDRLTPAERGGRKSDPKPEAVLKWSHHPIAMLGGLWDEYTREKEKSEDHRPPVFIIVCKNTKLSKVLYEWLAEGKRPGDVPPIKIDLFRNRDGVENTIRVDSKVVSETDTGGSKTDDVAWMRFTLDTVGKVDWPRDLMGKTIYPEGFEALAKKREKPLHPPGRDVRCIISVGMLTEGWDCNTVTHVVGLRPFQSQLLCEQVVGRGLRRTSYELGENGLMREEVAKVFGVPFEVIPMKANSQGPATPPEKRWHVRAVPNRSALAIKFPRVERYTQAIRDRITIDWSTVPALQLLPGQIAPEVDVKGLNVNNVGRLSLTGPGKIDEVSLRQFRDRHRIQELAFDLASSITREYVNGGHCTIPAHRLFPQVAEIVVRYLDTKVVAHAPADKRDVFLAPYWGWAIERFRSALKADTMAGEAPELPVYEQHRPPGTTRDVDYWTSRNVQEVLKSHVNYLVPDTAKWEQSAAYYLEKDKRVDAFVKNAGLGFAIPYFHNGQPHDYLPDFIVRLRCDPVVHLILETKGYDPLAEVKEAAAHRWVAAVNADGSFGKWAYAMVRQPTETKMAVETFFHGK